MVLYRKFNVGELIQIGIANVIKSWSFHIRTIDQAEFSAKTPRNAGVAQLVEHPICNRAVGSSSLSASTSFSPKLIDFTVLL